MPAALSLKYSNFGGGRWIRTTEAFASDLQSDPFGRSGIPPTPINKLPTYATIVDSRSTLTPAQPPKRPSILIAGQSIVNIRLPINKKMELARGVEPPTG